MVRITEELVRRRAEHNDGVLHSLREVTLHQFEIEKIELLGTLCRHLQILYLQNNLIGRIENLNRLKQLEYLNLAVNNIQLIEGLDRCESLQKLDLTLNFIDIDHLEESCVNLLPCHNLRQLYLMGNPLTRFPDWRLFIIAKLPQLESIDSVDITKTDRILARQRLAQIQHDLEEAVAAKSRAGTAPDSAPTQHTPEQRLQMYRDIASRHADDESRKAEAMFKIPDDPIRQAHERMAQAVTEGRDSGRLPRQHNQGRWTFTIDDESDDGAITVTINAAKYLDTSEIKVDVHPLWLQCIMKGKSLVLHLPVEVSPSQIRIQRIITTGQLVIIMARTRPLNRGRHRQNRPASSAGAQVPSEAQPKKTVDIRNIVKEGQSRARTMIDDADVPPLE